MFYRKLLTAIVIFIFLILALGSFGGGSSSTSCGHDSCATHGPFYCLGKNDTCNNRTGCAYVMYCSSCR